MPSAQGNYTSFAEVMSIVFLDFYDSYLYLRDLCGAEPVSVVLRIMIEKGVENMTLLRDMRIGVRLALGFGLVMAVAAALGGFAVIYFERAGSVLDYVLLAGVMAVGLLICGLVALGISRSVTVPVLEVAGVLRDVARGRLNVNLRTDFSDETGLLTRGTQDLLGILQALIYDMDNMSDEHDRGDIDVRIDSSRYEGDFRVVADKINYMVEEHIKTKKKVMAVFTQIADGNFDAKLEQLPGKKVFLNEAVDHMRTQINNVYTAVYQMIDAATAGDFSTRIDIDRYSGGWREIMLGLDRVAEAVAAPISEINTAMVKLSAGEFDARVTGSYKGDFRSIQESVNATVDVLSMYIHEMAQVLAAISGGDLRQKIARDYVGNFAAIKESINNITDTLNKTLSEITASSAEVLAGAKEIANSAMDLANGATTQASSVEQLNASMDEISERTRENADNATNANVLAGNSAKGAEKGNEAMHQMLDAMHEIKESSGSIAKITKDIQDIAFSTNLLSLNAAVEAARAGSHGKGFTVVADEVRNLAARSQRSATETTDIIVDSIERIDSGVTIARTTADSLSTIVQSASEVLEIVNNIAVSSKEQAEAIAEVSLGLDRIAAVVESNSAVSEETAAAAQELNSQAEILKKLVGYFML